ncbi:hypothetical protein AYI69_g10198 [Smittium culicis]|uniref:Uncharacterized protein n=1 Tax=Smittium culicis TaxID=133412 RepID=A0A1R1X7D5_9FUNG|nr:hypothetical protein AYI69_g10198 [Smittium culicis]
MERSLVLARDPGIGDLHGLQRFSVGDCGRPSHILRIMDTIRGEDAHKRQGTDDGFVCTKTQECDRTCGVSLLGQHKHTLPTRRGSICLRDEQESGTILQLVHRQSRSGTELIRIQMDGVQQPLCMPALESDSANRAEGAQGTNNEDFSFANVEIGHMVPGSDVPLCVPTFTTASNNSSDRSQKRKVSALGKQALELDSVEDQRRLLEAQGLETYAVDCILSNERLVRRRSR